ncbi:hypothetical protein AB4072_05085 [Microvirga sp. 2MCAF38]|uniref:hypothetical protein n=1 Tax=Microvirga sp. 2MCAF38 TaxID=3232989 RepID=UPI003F971DA6
MNRDALDEGRRALGFLGIEETIRLATRGITVPDPLSVLISPRVTLGANVTLWPNTILQCASDGELGIGAGTVVFPGTRVVASAGRIEIGSDVELGEEGGFTIKAENKAVITIGDGARLLGGGSLALSNEIGNGAQILGPIRCQNCRLGSGGTHREPDPDLRGGVLKGSGVARNIDVPQGHVIQSFDLFASAVMRPQSYFHPKPEA